MLHSSKHMNFEGNHAVHIFQDRPRFQPFPTISSCDGTLREQNSSVPIPVPSSDFCLSPLPYPTRAAKNLCLTRFVFSIDWCALFPQDFDRTCATAGGIRFGVWVNVSLKGFRMKTVDFAAAGMSTDVPRPLSGASVAVRNVFLPYRFVRSNKASNGNDNLAANGGAGGGGVGAETGVDSDGSPGRASGACVSVDGAAAQKVRKILTSWELGTCAVVQCSPGRKDNRVCFVGAFFSITIHSATTR